VLELGEALRDGVRRELREECAIEVEVGEMLGVFDRVLRDDAGRVLYHYVILDYAARWLSGEPRAGSDAARLRWVPLAEVDDSVLADLARRAAGLLG
ncbi:MAG: NUDIX domain-containing protein, partial [Chloroflexi bacterium]|nr:NUDIX domain-containing protein [Chloroflexota bacterium]